VLLKKGFFFFFFLHASGVTAVVLSKEEEVQEGQFNLECVSLVCQLLRFKRPRLA